MTLKKKSTVVAFVLLTLFVIAVARGQSKAVADSTGRYQVVPVEYAYAQPGGIDHIKTVFKIDTQTGQVWQWTVVADAEHKFAQRWVPLD